MDVIDRPARPAAATNGEGGIKNAYDLARETFIDGGVNRVILCTDGDFNVGVTEPGRTGADDRGAARRARCS